MESENTPQFIDKLIQDAEKEGNLRPLDEVLLDAEEDAFVGFSELTNNPTEELSDEAFGIIHWRDSQNSEPIDSEYRNLSQEIQKLNLWHDYIQPTRNKISSISTDLKEAIDCGSKSALVEQLCSKLIGEIKDLEVYNSIAIKLYGEPLNESVTNSPFTPLFTQFYPVCSIQMTSGATIKKLKAETAPAVLDIWSSNCRRMKDFGYFEDNFCTFFVSLEEFDFANASEETIEGIVSKHNECLDGRDEYETLLYGSPLEKREPVTVEYYRSIYT